MADFKDQKKESPTSKTWGFFFGGSGHGPESLCQILAYYEFLRVKAISTALVKTHRSQRCKKVLQFWLVIVISDSIQFNLIIIISYYFWLMVIVIIISDSI